MLSFLSNIVKGVFIGAGAILPGISSGVLCVIFGIYEKLVNSILGIFKDFKTNIKFLIPLFIGGIIGIITFGKGLNFIFAKYPMQSSFGFMGLILGTTPALIKKATSKGFKIHHLLYALGTFLFSLILIRYENISSISCINVNCSNYYYILCGFLMSIGIVVPGVSNTVILMLLGVYSIYLESISCLNLLVLIPMGIGIAIGSLLWLKIIQYLLAKFNTETFFGIIGFVFGSVLILYPGFTYNFSGISSIIVFVICLYTSFKLEQK